MYSCCTTRSEWRAPKRYVPARTCSGCALHLADNFEPVARSRHSGNVRLSGAAADDVRRGGTAAAATTTAAVASVLAFVRMRSARQRRLAGRLGADSASVYSYATPASGRIGGSRCRFHAITASGRSAMENRRRSMSVGVSSTELPARYTPESMAHFCAQRPLQTAARLAQILARCGGWALKVAMAREQDSFADEKQARELRAMLVDLGPSFVKVGQMLSSRVDLLPMAYITQLQTLTDRVEPFPAEVAKATLSQEWRDFHGSLAMENVRDLPASPIAAASLSQVYRLRLGLAGGVGEEARQLDVAVKVQRPDIHETICIDLFLLRRIATVGRKVLGLNTDLPGLVDEYGSRLLAELDFRAEAQSALAFHDCIAKFSMASTVCVAKPVMELTTRRVLVTDWIEGDRIDDVKDMHEARRLQRVALSAYLAMLLEVGALHADPHPGNLVRATDGRLCILDWGLVAYVTDQQRQAILKYVAHILARDYEAIPQDLLLMGFIAQGQETTIDEEEAIAEIATVFRELAGGGSARQRVTDILPAVAKLKRRYGNIAQIPNHFVYILRAFGILEGQGLRLDAGYKIVDDCYPYFISWLLRTPAHVSRPLLQSVLYGEQRGSVDQSGHGPGEKAGEPNAKQVLRLVQALVAHFEFSSASAEATRGNTGKSDEEAAAAAEDDLDLALSWLRQLLATQALLDIAADETARTADVLMRELTEMLLGPQIVSFVGLPRSAEDRAVLKSLQEILQGIVADLGQQGTGSPSLSSAFDIGDAALERLGILLGARLRNFGRQAEGAQDKEGSAGRGQARGAASTGHDTELVARAARRLAVGLLRRMAIRLDAASAS